MSSESATISSIASYGDSFALTQRLAARLNATLVSDAELNAWLEERAELLDKMLDGDLDSKKKARLRFVEWNIDKIEDARSGQFLDVLEGFALKYERFRADLKDFQRNLETIKGRR